MTIASPYIVNFLSTSESRVVIGISGLRTAMEKSDYEKISFGRVPFIWKKKINNLVKSNPDKAITIFFKNFQENNEPNQMIYGFEQLLPHSLVYILTHLEDLNPDRFIALLDLFTDSVFFDSLLSLETAKQKLFLNKIVQNWESSNKILIKKVLGQLDPQLSEENYKSLATTQDDSYAELLTLWAQSDVRVLYLVVQIYIRQPIEKILPLFQMIPKEKLISACSSQNLPNKLSPEKIEIFLKMFHDSQEEIDFLIKSFGSASGKARQHFIDWLVSKNITNSVILKAIPLKLQTQAKPLLITYFSQATQGEAEKEKDFLAKIIESSLFEIASSVLNILAKEKDFYPVNYLFSLLSIFEKNLTAYTQFFVPEFQKYSSHNELQIIEEYFQSKNENIYPILLPSLTSLKAPQWKKLIEQIIQERYFIDKKRVLLLLESFDTKTISSISKFIIKSKYIPQLSYLYENYTFFRPLLTTSASIEPEVYAQLANYMNTHFKIHFEEIIPYGSKISFPMSVIASGFTEKEIMNLVSGIGLEKNLISAWEEVLLLRPEESLPLLLEKIKENHKKSMTPLLVITKKLIDIEISTFWKEIASFSSKSLPKYISLLKYALERSIPILGEVISSLPTTHISFIVKNIIPDFSEKSSQMLYAILSIRDASFYKHDSVSTVILSILKLNPKELIFLILIRMSKLHSNSKMLGFVQNLFTQIIGIYPRLTIENIDDHSLSSFSLSVAEYTSTLSEKKFRILLKYIIPELKTKCLRPTLIDQCISRLRRSTNDYKLLETITTTDPSKSFSKEGQILLSSLIKQIIGRSIDDDIRIFTIVQHSHSSVRESLLIAYFERLPQTTLDHVLSDSNIDISENVTIRALTSRFAKKPPSDPEKYYIELYQQSQRVEIKRAVLPLIGEYCSWINLPFLMELPERDKFDQEYALSISKFIARFEIDSPETLVRIWSSGLKDIYKKTLKAPSISPKRSNYQSNCPKCNNPILEGQKNCGFCIQRLTCAICLKSVVKTTDVDLVECTQCTNYFHRHHLIQSVKMRNECPICGVRLTERAVAALPKIQFHFQ